MDLSQGRRRGPDGRHYWRSLLGPDDVGSMPPLTVNVISGSRVVHGNALTTDQRGIVYRDGVEKERSNMGRRLPREVQDSQDLETGEWNREG